MPMTQPNYDQLDEQRYQSFELALRDLCGATAWYLREVGFAIDAHEPYTRFDDIEDGASPERIEALENITEELKQAAQLTACGRGTCGREHAGCHNPRYSTTYSPSPFDPSNDDDFACPF